MTLILSLILMRVQVRVWGDELVRYLNSQNVFVRGNVQQCRGKKRIYFNNHSGSVKTVVRPVREGQSVIFLDSTYSSQLFFVISVANVMKMIY